MNSDKSINGAECISQPTIESREFAKFKSTEFEKYGREMELKVLEIYNCPYANRSVMFCPKCKDSHFYPKSYTGRQYKPINTKDTSKLFGIKLPRRDIPSLPKGMSQEEMIALLEKELSDFEDMLKFLPKQD